jgi:hypothetical protein
MTKGGQKTEPCHIDGRAKQHYYLINSVAAHPLRNCFFEVSASLQQFPKNSGTYFGSHRITEVIQMQPIRSL